LRETSPPNPLSFGNREGITAASPSPHKGEGWGEIKSSKKVTERLSQTIISAQFILDNL